MGKIISFDNERKTSNNKNLRMKQMTAVDMVRASQATLSKATIWKTRRIHLFGFVFVRKKWKLEADCSSLENPGAPLGKLTVEKVKVELSSLENRPRQASKRCVGKPLEEDAISPPGWDLSKIDFGLKIQFIFFDCIRIEIQLCSWLRRQFRKGENVVFVFEIQLLHTAEEISHENEKYIW